MPSTTQAPSRTYSEFAAPIRNGDKPSFDVHVYFHQDNEQEVRLAADLRKSIEQEFPELVIYRTHHKPVGPHPIGQFEVAIFTPAQFGALVPWLAIHHGSLSIVVHPNTGVALRDHTQSAMWLGDKLPLNTGIFDKHRKMDELAVKLGGLLEAQDLPEDTV
ncbi:MAG: hypothetical protein Q9207_005236 [Kuettlingeria erythrocarpa]